MSYIKREYINQEDFLTELDIKAEIKEELHTVDESFNYECDDVLLDLHECFDCNIKFSAYLELKEHEKEVHSAEWPGFIIKTEDNVDIDENPFLTENQSALEICPERNNLKEESEKRPYACNICNKSYKKNTTLYNHKLSHQPRRWQCDICQKKFSIKNTLKIHLLGMHFNKINAKPSNTSSIECQFCQKPFKYMGDLKRHVDSIHLDKKKFECEACGKRFARKWDFKNHQEIHYKNPFCCNHCGKQFNQTKTLRNHILWFHERKEGFNCDKCDRQFINKDTYRFHRKSHDYSHQCTVCLKLFTRIERLRNHMKSTHGSDKPIDLINIKQEQEIEID